MTLPLLVVTGLAAEARIAADRGCVVVAGGGDRAALARRLAEQDRTAFTAIVSFGVAGALDPTLAVGEVVLAAGIVAGETRYGTDTALVSSLTSRLASLRPRSGPIAGVDEPAATVAAKAVLARETGAIAVDMESHAAAAYGAARRLPFAAIRVVSDAADRAIPTAAARAMRPDGSVDAIGLLLALARDPGQVPSLLVTARDAAVAFRRLRRVRRLLGPGFGLHL